jgi:hypothetical protein
MLANKRLEKVGGCLRVLPERLAGGEREQAHKLEVAAAMAASGWRAGGVRRGLSRCSSTG